MEYYATICRLCEASDKLEDKWLDLFAAENDYLLTRIRSLANIELQRKDKLPRLICIRCQSSLEQAYNFKQQCRATDAKLRHEMKFLEQNNWDRKLTIPPFNYVEAPVKDEIGAFESEPLLIKSELDDDHDPVEFCSAKVESQIDSDALADDGDDSVDDFEEATDSSSQSSVESDDLELDIKPKTKRKRNVSSRQKKTKKSDEQLATSVCDTCGMKFEKPSLMYAHVRSVHGDKRFKCGYCPKTFARNARLKEHELQHTGLRQFSCSQCDRKYPTARGLKVHIEDIHSENLPYVCDKCGKGFPKEGKLRQHYSAHLDIRNYLCTVCSKGFKTRTNLNLHLQIHLPQEQRKMRKRENQHKVCICPFCGKVSTSLGTHNMHIRTHTGEQRYECHICFKRFTSSGSHQKHLRVHSGEKPFQCEFCQKTFRQKHHLTTHIRGVHKNENPEAIVSKGVCGRPRGVAAKSPVKPTTGTEVPVAPFENNAAGEYGPLDAATLTSEVKQTPAATVTATTLTDSWTP